MVNVLYCFCQCTWGIVQTLLGMFFFIKYRKERHYWYHGVVVTECRGELNISLGMFIFVTENRRESGKEQFRRLLVHEYGHTLQSLLLGPLYLPVIGLPSLLWCRLPYFKQRRMKSGRSYYSFYTEKWADMLGEWADGRINHQKVL